MTQPNQQSKQPMSDNSLKNKESMRDLIRTRYILQTVVIILILSAIFLAALCHLIEPQVTGALLGTAIGSILKFPFRSLQDSNKKKKEDEAED